MDDEVGRLKKIARENRIDILKTFYKSKTGHLASALSCIDILTALYFGVKRQTDRVILSKGHAAVALYVILSKKGLIPKESLTTFYGYDSKLMALASPGLPEIDIPTGSLGQGICFATGIAKSYQMDGKDACVYCIVGDGELQEGSVWEAALFAANEELNNLVVIVDHNNIQASDRLEYVMKMGDITAKWRAFGWHVVEEDGHDVEKLVCSLQKVQQENDKPVLILAHTIKGKGISFIADQGNCHLLNPKGEEWQQVCREFDIMPEELEHL